MSPIHFVSYKSSWLLTFEAIWGSVTCLTPLKEMEWRIFYKPKWEAMISRSVCVGKGSRWTQGQRWRQRRAGPHKYRQSQKVPENIKCAWTSLTQFKPAHVIIYLWRFVVDTLGPVVLRLSNRWCTNKSSHHPEGRCIATSLVPSHIAIHRHTAHKL